MMFTLFLGSLHSGTVFGFCAGKDLNMCLGVEKAITSDACLKAKENKSCNESCKFCSAARAVIDGLTCDVDQKDICGAFALGLDDGDCSHVVGGDQKSTTFCELGKYVQANYSSVKNKRAQSVHRKELQTAFEKINPSVSNALKNKILNQGAVIYDSVKYKTAPVPTDEELVHFLLSVNSAADSVRSKLQLGKIYSMGEVIDRVKLPCDLSKGKNSEVIATLNQFSVGDKIFQVDQVGKGTYKIVYPSLDLETGEKKVTAQIMNPNENESIIQEANLTKIFAGTDGIGQIDYIAHTRENVLTLIQPFYDGQLEKLGKTLRNGQKYFEGYPVEWVRAKVAAEILQGLSFVHNKGIVHRDIKIDNIMTQKDEIDDLPKAVIIDFGTAWDINGRLTPNALEFGGNQAYKSPEYQLAPLSTMIEESNKKTAFSDVKKAEGLTGKDLRAAANAYKESDEFKEIKTRITKEVHSVKLDIWQLGLVLYEFKYTQFLGGGKAQQIPEVDQEELMNRIDQIEKSGGKDYVSLLKEVLGLDELALPDPNEITYNSVVYRMLDPNPATRPSAEEAYTLMNQVKEKTFRPRIFKP